MPEVWSINTTVRNPERLQDFLRVLSEFEGQVFDNDAQAAYQKALVKNKLYKPNGTPEHLKLEYENEGEPFNDQDTEEIFSTIKDPDLRGRTSVSRCNQMGLAIALKSEGPVVITDLGRDFLENDFSKDENFFFNYFVKWQLPNPLEDGYNNFDINPFLATLYIINKVNDLEEQRGNKRKGISKNEFALFIITLRDYRRIDDVCESIIQFRDDSKRAPDQNEFFKEKLNEKAIKVFDVHIQKDIIKKANNLQDYADSAIRWFRKTQYIMYRGAKRYVDISPSRLEQAKQLVSNLPLSSNHYRDKESYRQYLVNKDLPLLPWEGDLETKKRIIINIGNLIDETQKDIDSKFPGKRIHDFPTSPTFAPGIRLDDLRQMEVEYRQHYDIINNELRTLKESDLKNLNKYIKELNTLGNLTKNSNRQNAPLCLEWYTSLSLMALDDSIEIKPNIVKADDGLPLFTAGGGLADIECYYESFNLIVEVTLIKSRAQVQNEVLPVSRHYSDMVEKHNDKPCYCLFLAPLIHRDAMNQFYFFINRGFEGKELKLIPLTINQYVNLLNIVLENSANGKLINHNLIEKFLKETVDNLKEENNSREWSNIIDKSIEEWGQSFA